MPCRLCACPRRRQIALPVRAMGRYSFCSNTDAERSMRSRAYDWEVTLFSTVLALLLGY